MKMDANTFARNLQKILGLPEREKKTSSEMFAPRILSETGSVNIGGADEFAAPVEQGETPPDPDTWVLPDFCRLYMPDDVGGQCYCLRSRVEEYYPCPEYYKSVQYTRDDWVNRVEEYIAARIYYKYWEDNEIKLFFGSADGPAAASSVGHVVGWSAIIAHVDAFAAKASHADFGKLANRLKELMSDMRNFKPVRASMENSDRFVAGFLDSENIEVEGNGGAYNSFRGYEIEWSGYARLFTLLFKYKERDFSTGKWRKEAEFILNFSVVDIPRLPTMVELDPPIVPDCIALIIGKTGFLAACQIDRRLPEMFKRERGHRSLTMSDEFGNQVAMTAMPDGGMVISYRNWTIGLDFAFVPTYANKASVAPKEEEAEENSENDEVADRE